MLNGLSNQPESQAAENEKMKTAFDQMADLFVAVLDTEQGERLLEYLEASTIQRAAFNIDDETLEKVALRGAFRAGQNAIVMQMRDVLRHGKNLKAINREAADD